MADKTIPTPESLASFVHPRIRDYIEAVMHQRDQALIVRLNQVMLKLQHIQKRMAEIEVAADPRQNGTFKLIEQFRKDFGDLNKTAITKANLIRLAREAGVQLDQE